MLLKVEFARGENPTPKACPFYYTARVIGSNMPSGLGLCQEEALASLIRQLKAKGLTGKLRLLNKDNGESLKERNNYLAMTFPHKWTLAA